MRIGLGTKPKKFVVLSLSKIKFNYSRHHCYLTPRIIY
jgi:hypothetical protein